MGVFVEVFWLFLPAQFSTLTLIMMERLAPQWPGPMAFPSRSPGSFEAIAPTPTVARPMAALESTMIARAGTLWKACLRASEGSWRFGARKDLRTGPKRGSYHYCWNNEGNGENWVPNWPTKCVIVGIKPLVDNFDLHPKRNIKESSLLQAGAPYDILS